jgi:RimJ/RimL family protein N-acetyltransferase
MTLDNFPDDRWADVWRWLHQFPLCNFDDYGPRNLQAFEAEMRRRVVAGEFVLGVSSDAGDLVGIIGFRPMAPGWGMFAGICFDKSVHGTDVTRAAVRAALKSLFERQGFRKVSAWYFADNRRVHHFLVSLGASEEGFLRAHTMRGGVAVDMRLVAFFNS